MSQILPQNVTANTRISPIAGRPREGLLINWVYYHSVGHAIEAYKMAAQLAAANPNLEVCVLLNATTATELAQCVPGLARVYPINLEEQADSSGVRPSLAAVPREWDYIYTDPRHDRPAPWEALNVFHAEARWYLSAPVVNRGWDRRGFPKSRTIPLRLRLPAEARAYAERFLTPGRAPRISLLFSPGSHGYKMPPLAFWRTLIDALCAKYPGVEIVLLGALDRSRSYSLFITAEDLAALERDFPRVRSAYDVGMLNQLALAERCDLHVSPHTGFSFAVQCVGTPWLVLTGNGSREYFLNGVPFVSLYPRCPLYPCNAWGGGPKIYHPMLPECRERVEAQPTDRPVLCAETVELEGRLAEILSHARALISRERPYVQCVTEHYQALLERTGCRPGTAEAAGQLHDWPVVLREEYAFERAPVGRMGG
jgi:ADP-heptose:LPS heptosyltransferase